MEAPNHHFTASSWVDALSSSLPAWQRKLWPFFLSIMAAALSACGQTAPEAPLPEAAAAATPVPAAPSPAPAQYEVERVDVQVIGAEDGLVKTGFSVAVRNLGELAGDVSLPVEVALDGGVSEAVEVIDALPGGQAVSINFDHELPPGSHQVSVRVAGSETQVQVDARVADITLKTLGHQIVGARSTSLEVEVGNQGDRLAETVVLSSEWTPDPSAGDPGGSPGSLARAAVITQLAPDETRIVAVPVYPETGAYMMAVQAETGTLEAVTNNNTAVAAVAVEYVQLSLDLDFVRQKGYRQDGKGIVEIGFVVRNEGVTPSGEVQVGVVCDVDVGATCSDGQVIGSVGPGSSGDAVATAVVEQGESSVRVFAGGLEDGYRWGDGNVMDVGVDVPERLPTHLALDAEASVAGYWSDETVNVEVTLFLHNEGYWPLEDAQPIALSCLLDEVSEKGCQDRLLMQLTDGFSPTSESLTLRLPIGPQEIVFDYGGEVPLSLPLEVPSRILGVTREVWECFSDRPGLLVRREAGDFHGGCAGWGAETIEKWPQATPVSVWATGQEDYLVVLEEVLEELAPLLDLEFRWVESRDEANFQAYVGVAASTASAVGFGRHCAKARGCAKSKSNSSGEVTSASIAVWLDERAVLKEIGVAAESIRRTTIHEALHALLPIHHRNHPASIMNVHNALRMPYLSPIDEALFRLHSHPLVRPGMNMAQVEELIVFDDALLDPSTAVGEPSAYEVVRSAFVALQQAGSASYKIRGNWTGRRCGSHNFGSIDWADYRIFDFSPTEANLVYLYDGGPRLFIIDSMERGGATEFWTEFSGGWRQVDFADFFSETAWARGFSSPHRMLASILFFAEAEALKFSPSQDGTLSLAVDLKDAYTSLEWSRDETLKINLVLDEQSHHIREYRMEWQFTPFQQQACGGYRIEAKEGEYGVEIPIPEAVLEGSANLSTARLP